MPAADIHFRPFVDNIKDGDRRSELVFSQIPAALIPGAGMDGIPAGDPSLDGNITGIEVCMVIHEELQ